MKRLTATTAIRPAQRGHEGFNRHRRERTVTHWFRWRHLTCKLQETSHYLNHGWTLLQLELVASRDTPCPLTTTGYLAHGIDAEELQASGGAVAFMTAWMDREAKGKTYQKAEFLWRQGDLFDRLVLDEDRGA